MKKLKKFHLSVINKFLGDFFKDESAQSMVEYILIGCLICAVTLGSLKLFKAGLSSVFNKTKSVRTGIVGIGP